MNRHSSLPELVPFSAKKVNDKDSLASTPSNVHLLPKEPSYRMAFEKDKNYVHKYAEFGVAK
jgi:hypothetical protein